MVIATPLIREITRIKECPSVKIIRIQLLPYGGFFIRYKIKKPFTSNEQRGS